MKGSTKAAIFIVLLFGILAGAYVLLTPMLKKKEFLRATDSKGAVTVTMLGDGYAGYGIIRSPQMARNSAQQGLSIDFQVDDGDYAARIAKFNEGKADIIVLPVNSYLEHGKEWKGVIVAGVARSEGADAIIGRADKFASRGLAAMNDAGLRGAFTPASPSEFLLNSLIYGTEDLPALRGTTSWRVEAKGSEDALARLKKGEVDWAVLWEPEVSKALADPQFKQIMGSDKTGNIVDVFVTRRDYLADHGDLVDKFFQAYFMTVQQYQGDRETFLTDMAAVTKLKREQVEKMVQRIRFFDVIDNAQDLFGVKAVQELPAREGVFSLIISCRDVMSRANIPLASKLDSPYDLIVGKKWVEKLVQSVPQAGRRSGAGSTFPALDEAGWSRLRTMFTLRVEPVTFQPSMDLLDQGGKEQVDAVSNLLENQYSGFRVIIRGHTGAGEDEEANQKLSQARAEAVMQYLQAVHNIDPNRMRAEGKGSSQPPQKLPDESQRAYRARMPRVEFVLVEGGRL